MMTLGLGGEALLARSRGLRPLSSRSVVFRLEIGRSPCRDRFKGLSGPRRLSRGRTFNVRPRDLGCDREVRAEPVGSPGPGGLLEGRLGRKRWFLRTFEVTGAAVLDEDRRDSAVLQRDGSADQC